MMIASALSCLFLSLLACASATAGPRFQIWPEKLSPPFEVRCRINFDGAAAGTAILALDYLNDGSYVAVDFSSGRISIARISGTKRRVLCTVNDWQAGLGGTTSAASMVRVRRSPNAIVIGTGKDPLCVARIVLPAPEQARLAVSNPAGPSRMEVRRIQRLGEITFNDDFMRSASSSGDWRTISGAWKVQSLGLPRFSANAFSYEARGAPALALAGHDFWSDYVLTAACKMGPGVKAAGIVFAARNKDNFYRFEWTRAGRSGQFRLVRRRGGHEVVLAYQPGFFETNAWAEFEVVLTGAQIEVGVDRRSILEVSDPQLYGGRIGLWAQAAPGQATAWFDDVRVERTDEATQGLPFAHRFSRPSPVVPKIFATDKYMKVWAQRPRQSPDGITLDYTFHRAPVDWWAATGLWRVRPRWACQPRWTWFGGSGPQTVSIWHKDRFIGKVDAEIFVAHPMDSPFDPIYRHPGNVGLTICGDGRNLGSGYCFLFAGKGNRSSRLFRRGKVVAETTEALLPDNRDSFPYKHLHINWYGLRVRRNGAQVSCFVDDKRILAWADPQPLEGQRVAVWTFDNSVLVARARVTADQIEPGPGPKTGTPPEETAPPPSSKARFRKKWNFESHRRGWTNRDGEQGAFLRLDASMAASGRKSLKLSNLKSGGSFAATVPLAGTDVRRTRLNFNYCIDPEVKINLYLKVFGWWYCLAFTAPEQKTWNAPLVGRFEAVQADGQWHLASVDLSPLLSEDRLVLPAGKRAPQRLEIEDAFFGLWSDDPCSLSGFQGNPEGASYHLDNFSVTRTRSQDRPPRQMSRAVPSTSGIVCDSWENLGGSDGLQVLSTPWATPNSSRALLLVNPKLGGIAGAVIRDLPLDASLFPVVAFDCRTDDTPRLDFQIELVYGKTLADRMRTVKFTDYDHTWRVIGKTCPDGVKTDGRWHHYRFNLGDMLRRNGDTTTVARLVLASGDYPGNEEGAHLWFKDFRLLPRPGAVKSEAHTPPPAIQEPLPPDRGESGNVRISVRLEGANRRVVPASICLSVGGHTYSLADSSLDYERESGRLTWDGLTVRPRPVHFRNGEKVACQLEVKNLAGMTASRQWWWRMRYRLDKTPPPAPFPVRVPCSSFILNDFERETPQWGDWGGCDVRTTQSTSALGQSSLRITSFSPSRSYHALCDVLPILVNKFPILSFDYRIDPVHDLAKLQYTVSMLVFDGERDRRVELSPLPAPFSGKWLHFEFDLRNCIRPGMGAPYGLLIGERKRQAKRAGDRIFIDNFSVCSRLENEITFRWNPPADSSGISGYNWCVDRQPVTVPPPRVNSRTASATWKTPSPSAAPGHPYYFHVRACDGAHNWGPPAHYIIHRYPD